MSMFVDVPAPLFEASAAFWTAVTHTHLGPATGDHDEFVPLEPVGDPCLWLQRTRDGGPDCHPDLYVEDVAATAHLARDLGARTVLERDGLVVSTSPGGLPFCLVRHRGQHRRPEPVGAAGERSVVDQVCLDIPPGVYDHECGFWVALTGWERYDDHPDEFERLRRPAGIPYAVLLQRLDDEQPAVGAHLDLAADDREAEVARHVAAGATVLRTPPGWTVLRDPAGMTYCVTGRAPGDV
jgi:hypothetical protein